MNDATAGVEVVQAEQHLLGDLAHNVFGDASVLITLDQAEQVLAEHLKHHAHVGAVGTFVSEVV